MITVTSLEFLPLTQAEIAKLSIKYFDETTDQKSESEITPVIDQKIVLQFTAGSEEEYMQICTDFFTLDDARVNEPTRSKPEYEIRASEFGVLGSRHLVSKPKLLVKVKLPATQQNIETLTSLLLNGAYEYSESILNHLLNPDAAKPIVVTQNNCETTNSNTTSIFSNFVNSPSQFFQSLKRTVNQLMEPTQHSAQSSTYATQSNLPSNSNLH